MKSGVNLRLEFAADVVVNLSDETFVTSGASNKFYGVLRKNNGIIWPLPNLEG